jgi:hypothetical protein
MRTTNPTRLSTTADPSSDGRPYPTPDRSDLDRHPGRRARPDAASRGMTARLLESTVSEADELSFVRARPRLVRIARHVLGNPADADDVVQDAWMRWQETDRSKVRDPSAFLPTTTTRRVRARARCLSRGRQDRRSRRARAIAGRRLV